MTWQETPLEEIRGRLIRLERQNRRLKQLGAAALIVAASLALMGQASQKKTVEANEFILRDNSGNVRARLSVDEKFSTTQLVLFDKEGKQGIKAATGLGPYFGSTLTLADGHGRDRVFLNIDDVYGGTLSLADQNGDSGTHLHGDTGELPQVTIQHLTTPTVILERKDQKVGGTLDADGLSLGLSGDGNITVVGTKSIGFVNPIPGALNPLTAAFSPDGLYLTDAQGFQAQLGVSELVTPSTGETHRTSVASLVLFGKDKHVIWKAP